MDIIEQLKELAKSRALVGETFEDKDVLTNREHTFQIIGDQITKTEDTINNPLYFYEMLAIETPISLSDPTERRLLMELMQTLNSNREIFYKSSISIPSKFKDLPLVKKCLIISMDNDGNYKVQSIVTDNISNKFIFDGGMLSCFNNKSCLKWEDFLACSDMKSQVQLIKIFTKHLGDAFLKYQRNHYLEYAKNNNYLAEKMWWNKLKEKKFLSEFNKTFAKELAEFEQNQEKELE